jgi:hypothetical protein
MRWLVIAAVLAAGCDDDDGPPSCKQVARELSRHGVIGDSFDAIDDLTAECKREGWPGEFRACVVKARSEREAEACEDRVRMGKKKDVSRPRRGEAEVNLERIERAAKEYFTINGRFPEGGSYPSPTPSTPCCDSGRSDRKCAPDRYAWDTGVWRELDFSIDEPHLFQYSYQTLNEVTFSAKAIGDLDCDGVTIEYELSGTITSGSPVFSLTKPHRAD